MVTRYAFHRFFNQQKDGRNDPALPPPPPPKADNNRLKALKIILSTAFLHNKESIILGIQASIMASFGFYLLRKVIDRYKHGAEIELLLDSTDYDYHAYGCTLTKEGILLLSKINGTTARHPSVDHLIIQVAVALRYSLFPTKDAGLF